MRAIRWVALAIVLLGAFYLWQSFSIRQSLTYSAVGPRFFPIAIGIGILLSGLWLFATPGEEPTEPESPQLISLDWPRLGGMALLIVAYIVTFKTAGYILSTAIMLVAGSQILGNPKHLLRDSITAIAIAVTAYFLFAQLLGINLPAGLIAW